MEKNKTELTAKSCWTCESYW